MPTEKMKYIHSLPLPFLPHLKIAPCLRSQVPGEASASRERVIESFRRSDFLSNERFSFLVSFSWFLSRFFRKKKESESTSFFFHFLSSSIKKRPTNIESVCRHRFQLYRFQMSIDDRAIPGPPRLRRERRVSVLFRPQDQTKVKKRGKARNDEIERKRKIDEHRR